MKQKKLLTLLSLIGLIIPIKVCAGEWDPYGVNMISKYDNNRVDNRNFKDFIFEVTEAHIISCSWIPYDSRLFKEAIRCAAYNPKWGERIQYQENGSTYYYIVDKWKNFIVMPAMENEKIRNYLTEDVIMIGSVDKDGNISTFSPENESVFMVAPGENIPCIGENGEVVNASGLSMAVVHVAGALANLLEKRNTFRTDYVFDALVKGTKKIGRIPYTNNGKYGKRNNGYGYGLLNISNSMSELLGTLGEDETTGI